MLGNVTAGMAGLGAAAAPAPGAFDVLSSLAIILCVAAATTVIFQRTNRRVSDRHRARRQAPIAQPR